MVSARSVGIEFSENSDMSYYLIHIFRHQTIFASDRRIIKWRKDELGKVVIDKIDSDEGKFFKLNPWTYFLGPSNGLLADLLWNFLRIEFGDSPVHLEELIKGRFDLQRKGQQVIEKAKVYIRQRLDEEGLKEEDLGIPFFEKPDCFICGVDLLNRPFLIDFRDSFRFQIYTEPGTCGAIEHDPETNKLIENQIKVFNYLTNNRVLYSLPIFFIKEYQKRSAAWLFPKIIKFISKRDFRVGGSVDLVSINKKGSEVFTFG